jgi:hypothetical protein
VEFTEFKATLAQNQPPESLSDALRALWHDAKGQFEAAHDIASNLPDPQGALLHAYLHRKEGDQDNAEYWYRRAQVQAPDGTVHAEWTALVERFLKEPV